LVRAFFVFIGHQSPFLSMNDQLSIAEIAAPSFLPEGAVEMKLGKLLQY
jgi:hypothetical protein